MNANGPDRGRGAAERAARTKSRIVVRHSRSGSPDRMYLVVAISRIEAHFGQVQALVGVA